MNYAVYTDLPIYSVASTTLTGISTTDQTLALTAASRFMDGYLIQKFTLPLTAVGEDMKQKCCDIATYSLLRRRGLRPGASPDEDNYRKAYDDALDWLKGIVRGDVTPYGVTDSSVTGGTGAAAELANTVAPAVLQPRQELCTEDGFWGSDGTSSAQGAGTPRRRGW